MIYKLYSFFYSVVMSAREATEANDRSVLELMDLFMKTQSTDELFALRQAAINFTGMVTRELERRS